MSSVGDHKPQGLAGEEISLMVAPGHETAFHPATSQAAPTYRPRYRKQGILRKREAGQRRITRQGRVRIEAHMI